MLAAQFNVIIRYVAVISKGNNATLLVGGKESGSGGDEWVSFL